MITLPAQSHASWTAGVTVLHVLAISSTIYRLTHRFRSRRTWWDDYLLFLPLIFDTVMCITFWFRDPKTYAKGQSSRIQALNSYWLTGFIFISIVWSSRAVLALSLVRIFPRGSRARCFSIALSVAMGLAWASAFIITTSTCKQSNGVLRVNTKTDCKLNSKGIAVRSIYLAVVDFLGDSLLVIAPLVLFWRIKLPKIERRIILTVSCSSFLTLLTVIAYISLTLNSHIALGKDGASIGAGLSQIESGVSLLVCNLAVITTCLFRFICNKQNPSAKGEAGEASQSCTCGTESHNHTTMVATEGAAANPKVSNDTTYSDEKK